jgi:hypothetical protein
MVGAMTQSVAPSKVWAKIPPGTPSGCRLIGLPTTAVVEGVDDGVYINLVVPPEATAGNRIQLLLDETERTEMIEVIVQADWTANTIQKVKDAAGRKRDISVPPFRFVGEKVSAPVVSEHVGVDGGCCQIS